MNKHILTLAAALTAVLVGGGCDYNDDNFEGLQKGTVTTDIKNLEITLTEADYKTISTNSANKALAGNADSKALGALATNQYFTPTISGAKYIPNFLAATYPTADNSSAIKVTYNYKSGEVPATVAELESAEIIALKASDYQTVWGADSENNFLTPAKSASKYLPAILSAIRTGASAGDLLWVDYNQAETEPSAAETAFEETFEGSWSDSWANVVTADNANSAVWVNKTYSNNNYAQCSAYKTTGATEVYLVSPAIEISDNMTFTFDACYGNYVEAGGRLKVLISADLADGAVTKASIAAATWTDISSNVSIPIPSSTYGTLGNVCTYAMNAFSGKTVHIAFRYDGNGDNGATTTVQIDNPTIIKGVKTPYSATSALCKYNGSQWSIYAPAGIRQIVKSDFLAMGSNYDSFDASFNADNYMPTLLKLEYPYAQAEEVKYVAYKYYDSGSKTRSVRSDEYTFDGTQWIKNDGIEIITDQFVKTKGTWMWDPSVTIILPVGKNMEPSTTFYQACVDWVKANVENGPLYVTSFGNNEYYTGASAYQGNLDWRVASARQQYSDAYQNMSDSEVTAALKEHTIEVFGAVLSVLYPDTKVIEGVDVTYTLQFGIYTGSTTTYKAVYKVVGTGKYEYVDNSFQEL